MKLLLTSTGISNTSIAKSLRKLLGKPFGKSKLVFIPTAANLQPGDKRWLIKDFKDCEKLGFAEINILNIDATPQERIWRPRVENADVLLFGGGNTFYLMYWLKKSGLARTLPKLLKTRVLIGISAGSTIAAPNLSLSSDKNRIQFKKYFPKEAKRRDFEESLGLVDFHIRSHLNSPHFPHARAEILQEAAKKVKEPIYAIDNKSAIEVVNRKIKIISEGDYLTFNV